MKTKSLPAYNQLAGKDARHWSRAFFKDTALCDMVCNNMCEAFNTAILAAQDKPIITMMEMIRNYLMTRLLRKMAELEKWSHLGPKVFRFVEKIKQESVYFYLQYSGNYTYQVRARGEDQFVVDINRRTCGCNKWQLIGIPYVHGMAATLSTNHNPMDFIHFRYKKKTFIHAYTPIIYGINRPKMWPKSNEAPMECPDFRKQKGRPKKKRNLQLDEVRIRNTTKLRRNYIVVLCRKCGKEGHNRATCDKKGGGTDNVATTEGGSQAEHEDGQPRGGKSIRT
ncbi:hypothetical protein Q3G72_032900 [Acer saccharum]|nr:hypothetical protein Q3G72_032900 [Acer saccharum]